MTEILRGAVVEFPVLTVVHPVADGRDGGTEPGTGVVHPVCGVSGSVLAAVPELDDGEISHSAAGPEVKFQIDGIEFLFRDRITDDGDPVTVFQSCAFREACGGKDEHRREKEFFHIHLVVLLIFFYQKCSVFFVSNPRRKKP